MENNDNATNLSSSLCTANCGFFGNPKFDGMCSQCYKDALKKKNTNPEATSSTDSPRGASPSNAMASALEAAGIDRTKLNAAIADFGNCVVTLDTTPSVETALPTVFTHSTSTDMKPEAAKSETESGLEPKQKKRNRCVECRKKVGLTGFECRCGGLYCSFHRYSDKHNCQFDYKKDAEQEIRKNNPVVIGQKIQKL